jgi:hypothetical protein
LAPFIRLFDNAAEMGGQDGVIDAIEEQYGHLLRGR